MLDSFHKKSRDIVLILDSSNSMEIAGKLQTAVEYFVNVTKYRIIL